MEHIQAKWYTKTTGRDIRLIVIHAMEAPEKGTTAESCARYFQTVTDRKVSAHKTFDNNSEVECVFDKDVAYAAPGANHDGLHYELAGYSKQSQAEWTDIFSDAMLSRAAVQAAKDCATYGLPAKWLTDAELRNGAHGIVDHHAISRVYHQSTHTDPGPYFPKNYFIELVHASSLISYPNPQERQVIMVDCVAARVCPTDNGMQLLQKDGSVHNTPGCKHYFGSWFEPKMDAERVAHPNSVFVDIVGSPNLGPEHYRIIATDGRFYEF